ncbi:hypothetical protein SCLCIDRAFT_1224143, partial [Scleroderma citrinum Foug A]
MTDGTGPGTESFLHMSPMVAPYLDLMERARGIPTSFPCAFCLSSLDSSAGGILLFTWFTLVPCSAQRHHPLGRVHFK